MGRGRAISPSLRAERRSRIVQSAYTVLTERGYENTAMSDIAKHAGVGQATLYRYFSSKRELLDGVFDYAVEKAASTVDVGALLADADDATGQAATLLISALGQSLFALVDEDPAMLRLLTMQSSAIDLEMRCRVIGLLAAMEANVASLFARFGPDPDADRAVLTMLGRMVVGSAAPGLMMSLAEEKSQKMRTDFLAAIESVSARGLFKSADDETVKDSRA